LRQTFANEGQKISEFSQAFVLLRQALDSSNIIQTAFISTRTPEDIEKLGVLIMLWQSICADQQPHGVVKIENLKLLNPVQMDASLRPKYLQGTRQDILATLTSWLITPLEGRNVLWLYGVAGSGKSTIATTVAQYFREIRRLGASDVHGLASGQKPGQARPKKPGPSQAKWVGLGLALAMAFDSII
jgi:predicted AAA+ superfamily ATPase